uniref:CCDC81 HU domain-containing protein n=1 Tax=Pavo cristatus TaxID=9049 RepID=A0A8C9FFW6_PAVCR
MEGCWTMTISSELVSTFPALLHLSAEEVVVIWNALSHYILEQLKLGKGVLVAGLGAFAVVQEQFHSEEGTVTVQRPVFQLDVGAQWLQDFQFTIEIIPDDVKMEPLNYWRLSQATAIPLHVVQSCVQETILLYGLLLNNKVHVPFAFNGIGVLTCEDNLLCMRFYHSCVTMLEGTASLLALLRSRIWPEHPADFSLETTAHGIQMFPRFQLTVKKSGAEAASGTRAAGERRNSTGAGGSAGRLLQRRETLPPSTLPSWEPGTWQQETAKKPSASVLPPCPGSSRRMKTSVRQEADSPAQPSTALPATGGSKRVLQELWEASAPWDKVERLWPVYHKEILQAQAERTAWDSWSTGEDQQPPQQFDQTRAWAPRPPAQPRQQQAGRRWRKAEGPIPSNEMGTASKLVLQADLLSPRAAQVLRRLEPHLHHQEAFAGTAERNRQKQAQKRQHPCSRCWYRSRGKGAENDGGSSGAPSNGAGKLSIFPPL